MKSSKVLLISTFMLVTQLSYASQLNLVCENPRGEYSVKFDEAKRKLILNRSTTYKILAIEKQDNSTFVAGSTVNGGPTFKLVLPKTKNPKFEFYTDEKLFQTDKCRYTK